LAVAGIKIERTAHGVPKYATIDLLKHTEFVPFLEKKGVELDKQIHWTAKMKRSFKQAEKGDWVEGDIKNFRDV
jgi:hypothetical protein